MRNLCGIYASYWKKTFSWEGRASRSEFWVPILINYPLLWCALVLFFRNMTFERLPYVPHALIIFAVFQLLFFLPSLSVYIRRFHDLGINALISAFMPCAIICTTLAATCLFMQNMMINFVHNLFINPNFLSFIHMATLLPTSLFLALGIILVVKVLVWICLLLPGQKTGNIYGRSKELNRYLADRQRR